MLTVYATYRNSDMTEGKGPMVLDKVFTDESDAQAYVDLQPGVMGRRPSDGWQNVKHGDWQVRPFQIMEHLDDGEEYERKQLIASANSKLTNAERKALGLPPLDS